MTHWKSSDDDIMVNIGQGYGVWGMGYGVWGMGYRQPLFSRGVADIFGTRWV